MLDQYIHDLQEHAPLSVDEEQRLARQFRKTGDPSARERLITANLRFVVSIAREYSGYRFPLDELIQQGNLGLVTAVRKFEPERGHRLISYAVWWIRASIQQYIIHTWSLVKVGTTQAQRMLFFRLNREWRRLESAGVGVEEAVPELARLFRVAEKEIRDMAQRVVGRDLPWEPSDQEVRLPDGLRRIGPHQEQHLLERELQVRVERELKQGMARLRDRERYIVERRYLTEDSSPSLVEVGRDLHLSRERVRQLEVAALGKLRQGLQGAGLPSTS